MVIKIRDFCQCGSVYEWNVNLNKKIGFNSLARTLQLKCKKKTENEIILSYLIGCVYRVSNADMIS